MYNIEIKIFISSLVLLSKKRKLLYDEKREFKK